MTDQGRGGFFDKSQKLALFKNLDDFIASNDRVYAAGSIEHKAMQRLALLVAKMHELDDRQRTVTPANAANLYEETKLRLEEMQQCFADCAALMQEAGVEFDRDLAQKVIDFKARVPGED
jgi:hypothetical protein